MNQYMRTEALRIIEHAAAMHGVTGECEIVGEAPGAMSSKELVPIIQYEAQRMRRGISIVPYRDLGASEDVVYMLNAVQEQGGQAGYLLFGSPLKDGHHQQRFDFDEEVLAIGAEMFVRLILACQSIEG